MLRIDQARAIPRALGFMLVVSLTAAGCGVASAKSRIKKPAPEQPSWDTPYAGATPPQVRFFTINAVLAKHDALSRSKPGALQVASADASSVAGSDVVSDLPPAAPVTAPMTSEEPFGLFTFRAPDGLLWEKWHGVETRMRAEAKLVEACRADDRQCDNASRKFVALANSAGVADARTRVEIVNRGINQAVRYVSDLEQHNVADSWSSPLETLAAGSGDCEDYAIAKFAVLLDAGIPEKDLRVLLVRDMAVRQDHAVLAVRVDGRWLVLDNRRFGLAETNALPYFMPLFAIDHGGVSLFAAPYAERPRHESEMDILPAADVDGVGGGQTLPLLL
jgi:predicted transglutaminase-like cysteine proteinase